MIPLKLSLQGIYSYQKKQEIDFTKLTQAQLFGIFGATGSGKSTILEAISFSLYGESERLNKRDNRGYNMMNLKSNKMMIDFEFAAEDSRYRFQVNGRRNSKKFDQITSFARSALQWNGEEWVPIDVKSAEEITGLSYDNFKRTIIIPQGKFQEFLQLTETDRTRMLKEIFKLEKYELFYKTASLEKRNHTEITRVETLILQLASVTLEAIESLKKELSKTDEEILTNQEKLLKLEKRHQKLDELKQLFEKINAQTKIVNQLKERSDSIKIREENLKKYESCLLDFKPSLDQKKELSERLEKLIQNVEAKKKDQADIQKDLTKAEKMFSEIHQQYLERDQFLKKTEELSKIIQLKTLEENITSLKSRVFNGDKSIAEVNTTIKNFKGRLNQVNQEIKTLRQNLPNLDLLMKIKTWFDQKQNLDQEYQNQYKQLQQLKNQKDNLKQRVKDILKSTFITPVQFNLQVEKLIEILNTENQNNQQKLSDLEQEREKQLTKSQLKHFSVNLTDGEPCPLCGSVHHPDIIEVGNVDYELKKIKDKIEGIRQNTQNTGKVIAQLEAIKEQIENLDARIIESQRITDQAESALDRHINTFTWKDYTPGDSEKVQTEFNKISAVNQEIDRLNKDKEAFETSVEKEEKKKELYTTKLDELKQQYQKIEIEFQASRKSLSLVSFEEYRNRSNPQIEKDIIDQKQKHREIVDLYQNYDQRIQKLRNNVAVLKGEISELEKQEQDFKTRIVKLNRQIQQRLESSAYSNLKIVEEILDLDLNIAKEKDIIAQFHQEYNSASTTLADLHAQVEGREFNPDELADLSSEIQSFKTLISELMVKAGGLKKDLERQENEWTQKQKLQQDLDQLKLRAEDLKVLKSMFNRSGFVNYVSTIFLRNLCRAANQRFSKLTKDSLSLEATSNNSFQVRDYLNNGQVRSVKTLSGGQTFQAALSLALALADEVQQQVKAKQNFFFLDEGFGSQDKNSLQVIFQTLKSLRQENRIVGIISHVEELQQEIDTYLFISNEDENGSRVVPSWE
jgi:exonuclease SbcC